MTMTDARTVGEDLRQRVADFLAEHDHTTMDRLEFLRARYDAGLAWVNFPEGHGGLGLPRALQGQVDAQFAAAGAPDNNPRGNGIGLGMAAPTILAFGTEAQKQKFLRPLWTGEQVWCQLFSEPGAGSDLAGLATSAVPDGDEWVISGQKVWTSLAHRARYALLLARTDPDQPKHKGLTYFVLDMHADGVETRPLRQMTGQAEFNEVYLTGARIPDAHRLGAVGNGWRVAMTTLMNERSAIGGSSSVRGAGAIGDAVELWARHPERRTPVLRDRLAALWTRAEAQRLTDQRARRAATSGSPGPEGSIAKLVSAELNQHVYEWCMDLLGPTATLYGSYDLREVTRMEDYRGPVQQRFLRSRANTIEGGTSEVLRNILGERILGLPGDLRADAGKAWKDVPRG